MSTPSRVYSEDDVADAAEDDDARAVGLLPAAKFLGLVAGLLDDAKTPSDPAIQASTWVVVVVARRNRASKNSSRSIVVFTLYSKPGSYYTVSIGRERRDKVGSVKARRGLQSSKFSNADAVSSPWKKIISW
jgi:hypothetical protein